MGFAIGRDLRSLLTYGPSPKRTNLCLFLLCFKWIFLGMGFAIGRDLRSLLTYGPSPKRTNLCLFLLCFKWIFLRLCRRRYIHLKHKSLITCVMRLLTHSGEGGIRTPGTRKRTHAFQACSLNHSDTSPFWFVLEYANHFYFPLFTVANFLILNT